MYIAFSFPTHKQRIYIMPKPSTIFSTITQVWPSAWIGPFVFPNYLPLASRSSLFHTLVPSQQRSFSKGRPSEMQWMDTASNATDYSEIRITSPGKIEENEWWPDARTRSNLSDCAGCPPYEVTALENLRSFFVQVDPTRSTMNPSSSSVYSSSIVVTSSLTQCPHIFSHLFSQSFRMPSLSAIRTTNLSNLDAPWKISQVRPSNARPVLQEPEPFKVDSDLQDYFVGMTWLQYICISTSGLPSLKERVHHPIFF